ncbi:MAG: hypothetical protein A2X49_04875 [Lentisphaerae bacterium GWF2_52_8]|nr:MAG: hypothetical protein A2X49_04875 [Lentisphaerae bacterium GWF2_52_8]
MKKLMLASFFLGAILMCGCGIFEKEPYRKVFYYDIGTPNTESPCAALYEIKAVPMGPSEDKMLFRSSPNQLEYDEFNRWASDPPELLKSYLKLALFCREGMESGKYVLQLDIFRFEMNLPERSAECCLAFSLIDNEGKTTWRKLYQQKVEAKQANAGAFAEAMQTAVKEISMQLAKDLQTIK